MCKVKKCLVCGAVKEMCGVCGSVCQQYLPLYFRKHGADGTRGIFDKEIYDISNGQTLCIPCHKKTDSYGIKQYRKMKERCS